MKKQKIKILFNKLKNTKMIVNFLNCVKSECVLSDSQTPYYIIAYGIFCAVSAIGIINNMICVYIFSFCKSIAKQEHSFFQLMNVRILIVFNLSNHIIKKLFVSDVFIQQSSVQSERLGCGPLFYF